MRTAHRSFADFIFLLILIDLFTDFCNERTVFELYNFIDHDRLLNQVVLLLVLLCSTRITRSYCFFLNAGHIPGGVGNETKVGIKIILASHTRVLLPVSRSPSIT